MNQPIAEMRVPIKVGGRDLTMIFNANSMCAYEEATGKFFLGTVADLFDAVFQRKEEKPKSTEELVPVKNPLAVIRAVPITDLRALLWATVHEYDNQDNPIWPLTLNQIGRLLQTKDIIPVFSAFLKGQSGNNPSGAEMGESQAEIRNINDKSSPQSTVASGGGLGIELPEDAFA